MIAVDTNVLVYAHREDSPHHPAAKRVLDRLAGGHAPWAIPWPCLHEFLAIVTHPRVYRPATPSELALDAVRALTGLPQVHLLGETRDHMAILDGLVRRGGVTGARIHDARVAALCLAHGVTELWSADRDFSWFPELRVHNPLLHDGA